MRPSEELILSHSFLRAVLSAFATSFLLFVFIAPSKSQSVIFSDPGNSYTDSDMRTEDFYGPIDISGCSSIEINLNYEFSMPWVGSGNMETNDECNFSNPCDGDPQNPNQSGCQSCWDFLWVRYLIDGTVIDEELIGEAGTTDAEQSGAISFLYCVDGDTDLEIEVYTQTWAGNETVTFSNIQVLCWEDLPVASASPNPICENQSLQLDEVSGLFSSWNWSGPNGFSSNSKDPIVNGFTSSNEGIYTVTVDDANGCPTTDQVEVLLAPTPSISTGLTIEECGPDPAQFDLTASQDDLNGDPTLIFEWYEDVNGNTVIGNPSGYSNSGGTVYVSIQDPSSTCFSDTVAVTLTVLPQPNFSVPPDVTVCEGLQVDLDTLVNPSNTNLTYSYHDGVPPTPGNEIIGTTNFVNNTTLSIIGTDANNCSDTQYVNLTVIDVPIAPPANPSGPYCEGEDIILSAAPPIFPLITYQWTGPNGYMATGPNQTIPNATPADEGIYELTATFSGCTSQPTSIFVEVNPLPVAPVVSDTIWVCLGDTLQLYAMSDPNSTYSWTGPNSFSSDQQNPIVSPNADPTVEGPYTVTPTLNGCTGMNSEIEVFLLDTPEVAIQQLEGIDCPGAGTASIVVVASGTSAPYTFDWQNDTYDGLDSLNDLSAGVYIVTVTDNNGCRNVDSIEIMDPPALEIFCEQDQGVSMSGASDGIGAVFISGGTPTFDLIYNGPAGMDTLTMLDSGSVEITGLMEGIYDITVTDANGCSQSCMFTITSNNCDLTIDSILLVDSLLCFGDSTASLSAAASGGSGTFTFAWVDTNDVLMSDSNSLNGIGAGIYTLIVEDISDSSCTATKIFILEQPQIFSLENCQQLLSASDSSLNDGRAQVLVSGGMSPYTLEVSGPDTFTLMTNSDTIAIDSLFPGLYQVLAMDKNGCLDTCNFIIESMECILSLSIDTTYFTACPGDSSLTISLSNSDTSENVIYIWNGDTTNYISASNLPAGFYQVIALDTLNGCRDSLLINRQHPSIFNFSCTVFEPPSVVGGNDGSAGILVDSLLMPYSISISSHNFMYGASDLTLDTFTINGLDSGIYFVTITDSLGCTDTCSFIMPDGGCEVFSLDSIYTEQPGCSNNGFGFLEVFVSGGSGNYDFDWNVDSLDGKKRGIQLPAGRYEVTVTDLDLGCVVQGQKTLLPTEELSVEILSESGFCSSDSVRIEINVLEGLSPYILEINSSFEFSFLSDTTFYLDIENPLIEVRDDNGCVWIDTLSIVQFEPSTFDLDTTICTGDSITILGEVFHANKTDGSVVLPAASSNGCDSIVNVTLDIEEIGWSYELLPPSCENGTNTIIRILSVSGGGGYRMIIDNQAFGIPQLPFEIDGLEEGLHELYLESQNSCISPVDTIEVLGPEMIHVSIEDISNINPGDTIVLSGSTNSNWMNVLWQPDQFISCDSCLNTFAYPTQTTTYQLFITDSMGCTGSAEITVIVTDKEQSLYIPNIFTPDGDGVNDFFTIYGNDISGNVDELLIYDRWGNLIFENRNFPIGLAELGWDGRSFDRELQTGVYIYSLKLTTSEGERLYYKGSVTLLK